MVIKMKRKSFAEDFFNTLDFILLCISLFILAVFIVRGF
jgi:hypothetical protein